MESQTTCGDLRCQISAAIEADPVSTYDLRAGNGWGAGLERWIPEPMRAGVACYVLLGTPPGHFLRAIIEGDFFEACRRADDVNGAALRKYALFLHNYAPGGCFGRADHLADWVKAGGIIGLEAREMEPC